MNFNKSPSKYDNTYGSADIDLKSLMDSLIDADSLRKASLKDNLDEVTELVMIVNTSIQSLCNICIDVPNLTSLTLDHSIIASVRDIGSGYQCLQFLSLADCSLMEVDGIGAALPKLKFLNLDDNLITEVSALAMHDYIEVLLYSCIGLCPHYLLRICNCL